MKYIWNYLSKLADMCLNSSPEYSSCNKVEKTKPTYSYVEVCENIDRIDHPLDLAVFMGIAEDDVNLYSETEREIITQLLNEKVDSFGEKFKGN